MKPITLGHYCSVKEIEQVPICSKQQLRERVKFLIVDDEPFVYLEQIRQAKFNITQVSDVQDLNAVSEYDVVICDINGVGHCFESEYGGAFLVSQLKNIYPYKQYAVYSGKSDYSPTMSELLQGVTSIKKDFSIDQWISYLDQYAENVANPILVWGNIRDMLYKKNVSSFVVTMLEDEYVRAVRNRTIDVHNFPSDKLKKELVQDVKSLIQSFISNLFITLLLP